MYRTGIKGALYYGVRRGLQCDVFAATRLSFITLFSYSDHKTCLVRRYKLCDSWMERGRCATRRIERFKIRRGSFWNTWNNHEKLFSLLRLADDSYCYQVEYDNGLLLIIGVYKHHVRYCESKYCLILILTTCENSRNVINTGPYPETYSELLSGDLPPLPGEQVKDERLITSRVADTFILHCAMMESQEEKFEGVLPHTETDLINRPTI